MRSKKILLADDHPQTVRACRAALEQRGFEVIVADSLDRVAVIVAGTVAHSPTLPAGANGLSRPLLP